MRIQPYASALLSVVFLLSLASCDRSRDQIVGKWRVASDASGTVWEFSPNRAVTAGNTRGKYTLDRKRLKIQTPNATFVYELELAGDTMVWREPNGSRTELKRVP